MASSPNFSNTPNLSSGRITTADTSLTAPAAAVLCFTAGASGSRIFRIDIVQVSTSSVADFVNLFWYDGTNYRLWRSIDLDALTVGITVQPASITLTFPEGLGVPGTGFNRLYATTYNGSDYDVTVYGGDF